VTPAPGEVGRGAIPHLAEAVITAAAGASLGALAGSQFGVAIPIGLVGGINGAVCGWRGTYDWRSPGGVVGFGLDSTWAFGTTAAALLAHVAARVRGDAQYDVELSRRHNRHVYGRGFQLRKGFAFTLGNVIAGAGDLTRERRRRLITDHEDVHVWQARWFGPLYPVLYVGWMLSAGLVGAAVWTVRRRGQPFGRVVESCAYYLNPFEWWAYSRDDHWPPKGLVAGIGWKRPLARPFGPVKSGARSGGEPAVDVGEEVGGGFGVEADLAVGVDGDDDGVGDGLVGGVVEVGGDGEGVGAAVGGDEAGGVGLVDGEVDRHGGDAGGGDAVAAGDLDP
jgi:hypothetical protein